MKRMRCEGRRERERDRAGVWAGERGEEEKEKNKERRESTEIVVFLRTHLIHHLLFAIMEGWCRP